MDKVDRSEIIKNVLVISDTKYSSTSKELNILRLKNGILTYHFGVWAGNQCIQAVCLNYSEVRSLAKKLNKDILKENELDKFQKDFIQQIHNGSVTTVQKEKEKEIDLL